MAIKDLKMKMLEEASAMIKEDGIDNFSVRILSRRLNVSHNAMYRHFKTRSELLFTLLMSAYEHIYNSFTAIISRNDISGISKFRECVNMYIEFAFKNPHIYKMMFAPDSVGKNCPEDIFHLWEKNYLTIVSLVRESLGSEPISNEEAQAFVDITWAFAHGLVYLVSDGMFDRGESQSDSIAEKSYITVIKNRIDLFFEKTFSHKKG